VKKQKQKKTKMNFPVQIRQLCVAVDDLKAPMEGGCNAGDPVNDDGGGAVRDESCDRRMIDVAVMGYQNMIAVLISEYGKLGTLAVVTPDSPLIGAGVSSLAAASAAYRDYPDDYMEEHGHGGDEENNPSTGAEGISVTVRPLLGTHGPTDVQSVHVSAYGQALYTRILQQQPTETRPLLLNCSLSPRGEFGIMMQRLVDCICSDKCRVW
jgi:hypothetical protein